MAGEERNLPLFPLNMVLFPNASLPLQIFEERYKQMLEDCLQADSRFGVILIKAGAEVGEPAIPYSIGTMAHIIQVHEARGGRRFISAMGERRFRIKEITQYRPYISAQIEVIEDEGDEWLPHSEMDSIRRAVKQYVQLVIGLKGGWTNEPVLSEDPVTLSYYIAGLMEIGLPEKQTLLEESSTSRRLEAELDLLRRELEPLKKRVSNELRKRFSRH